MGCKADWALGKLRKRYLKTVIMYVQHGEDAGLHQFYPHIYTQGPKVISNAQDDNHAGTCVYAYNCVWIPLSTVLPVLYTPTSTK